VRKTSPSSQREQVPAGLTLVLEEGVPTATQCVRAYSLHQSESRPD